MNQIAARSIERELPGLEFSFHPEKVKEIQLQSQRERALIIEDNRNMQVLVAHDLSQIGLYSEFADGGDKGLRKAINESYDLVVIDLSLQSLGGLEVCRKLREAKPEQPIFLVTEEANDTKTIIGLEIGADDYIEKPFNRMEFQARVRALMRRYRLLKVTREQLSESRREKLGIAELTIDVEKRHVFVGSAKANLSPTEFNFVMVFAKNPGQVFSRDQLVQEIWDGGPSAYEQNVRSHISNIRAKLKAAGAVRHYIVNERGFGYRFIDDTDLA